MTTTERTEDTNLSTETTQEIITTTTETTTLIDETAPVELNSNGNTDTETLQTESISNSSHTDPVITNIVVTGAYNDNAVGVDYYQDITISLIGDNLTNHHFLTKEGLHWSDKTTVEVINSVITGQVNGHKAFGKQNAPNTDITMYRNYVGDSGRLTFVSKTKSGIDLDLIWTITDSNHDDWQI